MSYDEEALWQLAVDERNAAERKVESLTAERDSAVARAEAAESELVALRRVVDDAIERMDRARRVLTNGNPTQFCNWGVLDTSDIIKRVLAATPAAQEPGS